MPELNLIEDDNSGGSAAAPSSAQRRRPPRGGGFGRVLIILLALIFVFVGVYLANQYGLLNLWGQKSAPETAQEQPAFPEEPFQGTPTPAGTTGTTMTDLSVAEQPVEQPLDQSIVTQQEEPPVVVALEPEQSEPVESAPPPIEASDLSAMSGNYTIQVSAWKDRAMADDLTQRLVRAGFPAFVEPLSHKGGTWYTVRVGRYASRQDAQAALRDMPLEIRENYWIDKVRAQ
jgi:septal ring-binding cell division protein DamX